MSSLLSKRHHRLLILSIVFCQITLLSKGQSSALLLGKDIGEVRFILERKGIALSNEVDAPDNMLYATYKSPPSSSKNMVDLQANSIILFDKNRGGVCTQVNYMPGIQDKWVTDTLMNRLLVAGFKRSDLNTFVNEKLGCVAFFKYERAYATPEKPLNIFLLKLVFYLPEESK